MRLQLWLGPLIGVFGLLSYFLLFVQIPALRDHATLNLGLVLLGAGLSIRTVLRAFRSRQSRLAKVLSSLAATLSILCAGLLFAYVFSLSYSMPKASKSTLALASIPAGTLVDQNGANVAIEQRDGRKLILTFYRGHW